MPSSRTAHDVAAARLRRRLEDAIERLIAFLDELDGDADLEPSLGWALTTDQSSPDFHGDGRDLESEHDGREPDEDFEGMAVLVEATGGRRHA